jgi:predicted AAA+ superfamily ATPase
MLRRRMMGELRSRLSRAPVAALLGSRQVGKTTLAKQLMRALSRTHYLDLERPSDLARLRDAELYLSTLGDRLVVIDEIQRRPDLFPLLRSIVDERPRAGRFLILGSASPHLLRQSSESLAGRISTLELTPFGIDEVPAHRWRTLWTRGGYPRSYLARSDAASTTWRADFIQTHLERDLPSLGIRVPATRLRRFWEMIAHGHAQTWNASAVGASLGVAPPTARHYLDMLEDTFMIRQLQPYFRNVKKRLVKAPKIYLRDSGLLHALLGLPELNVLLGHPVAGPSFEGFVIEQICTRLPTGLRPFFYRTHAGSEVDLVIADATKIHALVEIKLGLAPAVSRGIHEAMNDLRHDEVVVVYPGTQGYPLAPGIRTLPIVDLPGWTSRLGQTR